MKYYVLAKKYDEVLSEQISFIAGEFSERLNAQNFMDAYT